MRVLRVEWPEVITGENKTGQQAQGEITFLCVHRALA